MQVNLSQDDYAQSPDVTVKHMVTVTVDPDEEGAKHYKSSDPLTLAVDLPPRDAAAVTCTP